MSIFLKEYRCEHCNKLFFKGDLKHCTIEVKCKNCKNINTIEGMNCKLFLLPDQGSSRKKNDGSSAPEKISVQDAIIQCAECEENGSCEYHKTINNSHCPFCDKCKD